MTSTVWKKPDDGAALVAMIGQLSPGSRRYLARVASGLLQSEVAEGVVRRVPRAGSTAAVLKLVAGRRM